MCGRFISKDLASIERHFNVRRPAAWWPSYNIAPSQLVPVVRRDPDTGVPALEDARWGFVPAWAADAAKWPKPINARVETLFEKPTWRTAIRRSRCLVPADGWYEWQVVDGRKVPYYIQPREPVALAGVWDRHALSGLTFAVLVGPPPASVAAIHDRAPVVLTEDTWDVWVDPSLTDRAAIEVLLGREPPDLEHWTVSTRVNKPLNNEPDLILPAVG